MFSLLRFFFSSSLNQFSYLKKHVFFIFFPLNALSYLFEDVNYSVKKFPSFPPEFLLLFILISVFNFGGSFQIFEEPQIIFKSGYVESQPLNIYISFSWI